MLPSDCASVVFFENASVSRVHSGESNKSFFVVNNRVAFLHRPKAKVRAVYPQTYTSKLLSELSLRTRVCICGTRRPVR